MLLQDHNRIILLRKLASPTQKASDICAVEASTYNGKQPLNNACSFVRPSHSHLGQVAETSRVKRERLMTGRHEGLL